MFVIFSCLHHTLYPLLSPKCPVLYHGVQLEDLVALLQRISRGTRSQVVPALVGNCRGQCPEDRGNFRARVLVLLRTAKVLRQLLNDKTIRQVLGQFSSWLHVQRVSGIQGRVENVGRMSTFAQRELDRVFFI